MGTGDDTRGDEAPKSNFGDPYFIDEVNMVKNYLS